MLSIVLFILKFIGILLLVILGIVLLILASVLFIPIRYRLDGIFTEEKKKGEVQVSWAGPVIKGNAGYEYGSKFYYFIRILGITMLASDDRKTIFTRYADWKRRREEKKYRKAKKKESRRSEEETAGDRIFLPEAERPEDLDFDMPDIPDMPVQDPVIMEKEEINADSYVDYENIGDIESDTDSPDDWYEEEHPKKQKSESGKKTVEEPSERWYNKFIKIIAGIPERIEHAFDHAESFQDHFVEKAEDLYDKYETVEKFYYKKRTNDVVQRMIRLVWKTLNYVLPVRYRGYLHYGFSDPAITGKTYGILCMLGIALRKDISIEADFQEAVLEGDLSIRGRVRIIYFVRIAVRLFFDKQLKAVYKEGKAVAGGIRS